MAFLKKIIGIFIIVILSLSPLQAKDTVRLTTGEYSPFMSLSLKYDGVVSRMVVDSFAMVGHKASVTFLPWKRAFFDASKGKDFDGTFVWFKTPEREKEFYFSDPVIDERLVFFHLKSYDFDWNTVDDLSEIPIGGIRGFTMGSEMDKAEKEKRINVEWVTEDTQNFHKLLKGRIRVFPHIDVIGYETIRNKLLPEQQSLITHHSKAISSSSSYLLLSKKNPENEQLIKIFNKGLKLLKENGSYDQYLMDLQDGKY